MEVNVEKIMREIRSEIYAEGSKGTVPQFSDFLKNSSNAADSEKSEDWENLTDGIYYIVQNRELEYYCDFGSQGMKSYVKKAVRKALKFLIYPILQQQVDFNTNVVQCISSEKCIMEDLMARQRALELKNAELEKKIEELNKIIAKQ